MSARITTDHVASVKRVSGPHFNNLRHNATGAGWVVDTWGEVSSDGRVSVHAHYVFTTDQEAKRVAAELREKMT
jgi:hypothetical protein